MTSNPVKTEIKQGVALITLDNPPVNALSQAVRQGLLDAVEQANKNPQCQSIAIVCAGKTFVAGADISEFGQPPREPHLPDVLAAIEDSAKPVVIGLHGTALGGGFELALAGHYRVALRGTRVGLPEVTLGLIPGAGGTQRLPRLAGLETALQMITSGKPTAVEQLQDSALLDRVVDADLTDAAENLARQLGAASAPPVPVSARQLPLRGDEAELLTRYRVKVAKSARGQDAPLRAIEALENALSLTFADAMKAERALFLQCRQSPQSRAMRHAFFAERAASKVRFCEPVGPLEIQQVGVIGAGTMGSGIAMCFASSGYDVLLLDTSEEGLQRGLDMIKSRYQEALSRGRVSEHAVRDNLSRIARSTDYQSLANADLIVEAAFESMQVKIDIFSRLDSICRADAILATNTSYLNINSIAAATGRPQRVLGMHFFSPANVMRLLEVVRADQTGDQALATALAVGRKLGKIAVPVGVCYGFVGNRMYACYGREANRLLLEGATPRRVDDAMRAWGMAMGPLAVADMSGIDIGYKARRENPHPSTDPQFFLVADRLVQQQRLGRKTGAGFYRYEDGRAIDDADVEQLIVDAAAQFGVQRRAISDEEIQQRLIYALINEGCRILEEGIVDSASAIDAIWLNGYGFPRYRGGPMQYADEVGLGEVLGAIDRFSRIPGDRHWQASALLTQLQAQGQSLADYARSS